MSIPAYQQIKNYVAKEIQAARWREGDMIPSEHDLVREFGVARMTVNRAMRELVVEGLLRRTKGAGTYVAGCKYQSTLVEIRSIADEIRERGHTHSAKVLKLETRIANAECVNALGLKLGASVFFSLIVHSENAVPIQLEARYVHPTAAPDYLRQDFNSSTPSEYLTLVAPATRAQYRVEATLPDAAMRRQLAMPANEPCLSLYRATWSGSRAVTFVELHYPASRYSFRGVF
jgi:GntR family transcriptional regulator, histidine utilization repressor